MKNMVDVQIFCCPAIKPREPRWQRAAAMSETNSINTENKKPQQSLKKIQDRKYSQQLLAKMENTNGKKIQTDFSFKSSSFRISSFSSSPSQGSANALQQLTA